MNPLFITSVVALPGQTASRFMPHHAQEDRVALSCGFGRTGAIQILTVGHKLQQLIKGQFFERLPMMFSAKMYAGSPVQSLLLIVHQLLTPPLPPSSSSSSQQQQQQQQLQQPSDRMGQKRGATQMEEVVQSQPASARAYATIVFSLHADSVDPIDPSSIGIDPTRKTLAFAGAQGAFVQVTTNEVRVVPTIRYLQASQPAHQSQQAYLGSQSARQSPLSYSTSGDFYSPTFSSPNSQEGLPVLMPEAYFPEPAETQRWTPPYVFSEQQLRAIVSRQQIPASQVGTLEMGLACVTDNLIACSFMAVVFVLMWKPGRRKESPKPSAAAHGKRHAEDGHANGKKRKQTQHQLSSSVKELEEEEEECGTNGTKHPHSSTYRTYVKPCLSHVATLCFPSVVTALSAATICGRSFLLVGCRNPPAVYAFRIEQKNLVDHYEDIKEKYWNYYMPTLANRSVQDTVLPPPPASSFQPERHFIEVSPGSSLFIENLPWSSQQHSSPPSASPSRLATSSNSAFHHTSHHSSHSSPFSSSSPNSASYRSSAGLSLISLFFLPLQYPPQSLILTTFNRQVRVNWKDDAPQKTAKSTTESPASMSGAQTPQQQLPIDKTTFESLSSSEAEQSAEKKPQKQADATPCDSPNEKTADDFKERAKHFAGKEQFYNPFVAAARFGAHSEEQRDKFSTKVNEASVENNAKFVYDEAEGAVLLVGCKCGQVACSIIPLSLILDIPPSTFSISMEPQLSQISRPSISFNSLEATPPSSPSLSQPSSLCGAPNCSSNSPSSDSASSASIDSFASLPSSPLSTSSWYSSPFNSAQSSGLPVFSSLPYCLIDPFEQLVEYLPPPPTATFVSMGRAAVNLMDDGTSAILYNDHTARLSWNSTSKQLMWIPLSYVGPLHSVVQMRVSLDDSPQSEYERELELSMQRKLAVEKASLASLQREQMYEAQDYEGMDTGKEYEHEQSATENKNEQSRLKQSLTKDTDITTTIGSADKPLQTLHPTLAWIGYVDRFLIFGTIDKRMSVCRQTKDVPSVPSGLTYVPELHAVVVLCREYVLFKSVMNSKPQGDWDLDAHPHYWVSGGRHVQSSAPALVVHSALTKEQHFMYAKKEKERERIEMEAAAAEKVRLLSLEGGQGNSKEPSPFNRLGGLGIDLAPIAQRRHTIWLPFREIVMAYMKRMKREWRREEKGEVGKGETNTNNTNCNCNRNNASQSNQFHNNKPRMSQSSERDLSVDSARRPLNPFTSHLRQSFSRRAPRTDFSGVPMTDISHDWFIDRHRGFPRDYRPLCRLPKELSVASNCYSSSSFFCDAFPPWLTDEILTSQLMIRQWYRRARERLNSDINQKGKISSDGDARHSLRFFTAPHDKMHPLFADFLPSSSTSEKQLNANDPLSIGAEGVNAFSSPKNAAYSTGQLPRSNNPNSISLIAHSPIFDDPQAHPNSYFPVDIAPSYVLLVFDECDMRMRIGRIDLSQMELHALRQTSHGGIAKTDTSFPLFGQMQFPSTAFYSFFSLVHIPVPTIKGIKVAKHIEEKVYLDVIEQMKKQLEENQTETNQQTHSESSSASASASSSPSASFSARNMQSTNSPDGKSATESVLPSTAEEAFDRWDKMKAKSIEPMGKGLSADEFKLHYIRTLVAVAGRESTLGRKEKITVGIQQGGKGAGKRRKRNVPLKEYLRQIDRRGTDEEESEEKESFIEESSQNGKEQNASDKLKDGQTDEFQQQSMDEKIKAEEMKIKGIPFSTKYQSRMQKKLEKKYSEKRHMLKVKQEMEESSLETLYTDIFIFEIERQTYVTEAFLTARRQYETAYDNYYGNGEFFKSVLEPQSIDDPVFLFNNPKYRQLARNFPGSPGFDMSQPSFAGQPTLLPKLASSPVANDFDMHELFNVIITPIKRVRIVGGVQGLFAKPSILVALNGCDVLVFGFCSTLSRSAQETEAKEEERLNVNNNGKNKSLASNVKEEGKDNKSESGQSNISGSEVQAAQSDESELTPHSSTDANVMQSRLELDSIIEPLYPSSVCSCSLPLFDNDGKLAPLAPYHFSIVDVIDSSQGRSGFALREVYSESSTSSNNNKYDTSSSSNAQQGRMSMQQKEGSFGAQLDDKSKLDKQTNQNRLKGNFWCSPLSMQLISYLVAPAPVTTLSMVSQRPKYDPALPVNSLTYPNWFKGKIHSSFSKNITDILHRQLDKLLPSFFQIPKFIRFLLGYAPCGIIVADLALPASFPLSISLVSYPRRVCMWYQSGLRGYKHMKDEFVKHSHLTEESNANRNNEQNRRDSSESTMSKTKSTASSSSMLTECPRSNRTLQTATSSSRTSFGEGSMPTQNRSSHNSTASLRTPSSLNSSFTSLTPFSHPSSSSFSGTSSSRSFSSTKRNIKVKRRVKERNRSKHHASKTVTPISLKQVSLLPIAAFTGSHSKKPEMKCVTSKTNLCQSGATIGSTLVVMAHTFTPSLSVEAQMLDFHHIGVISDYDIIVYSIVQNPYYNAEPLSSALLNSDDDVILPLCTIPVMRIPTHTQALFILTNGIGSTSLQTTFRSSILNQLRLLVDGLKGDIEYLKQQRRLESEKEQLFSNASVSPSSSSKPSSQNPSSPDSPSTSPTSVLSTTPPTSSGASASSSANSQQQYGETPQLTLEQVSEDLSYPLRFEVQSGSGSLQALPEHPPFLIFSRQGWAAVVIPSYSQRIPALGLVSESYAEEIVEKNFGDIWRFRQSELIKDYIHQETQIWNAFIENEAKKEAHQTVFNAPSSSTAIVASPSQPPSHTSSRILNGTKTLSLSPPPLSSAHSLDSPSVITSSAIQATISSFSSPPRTTSPISPTNSISAISTSASSSHTSSTLSSILSKVHTRYHCPPMALKPGRYYEGQIIYGLSVHPHAGDSIRFKYPRLPQFRIAAMNMAELMKYRLQKEKEAKARALNSLRYPLCPASSDSMKTMSGSASSLTQKAPSLQLSKAERTLQVWSSRYASIRAQASSHLQPRSSGRRHHHHHHHLRSHHTQTNGSLMPFPSNSSSQSPSSTRSPVQPLSLLAGPQIPSRPLSLHHTTYAEELPSFKTHTRDVDWGESHPNPHELAKPQHLSFAISEAAEDQEEEMEEDFKQKELEQTQNTIH